MALSSSWITSDNAALLRQHTMDYLHRNTWWNWRHHQRNKMLRLNYSNAHTARTAQIFWNYSQHTSSVRTWENVHRHRPRDTNSREIIIGINSATRRRQVTSNGVPTQLGCWHWTRTPRFTAARAAVILEFDNYCECMHDYVHRNPLLLLTLSHIPSNITLFSYTQTPKPSHGTSRYPITIHTQHRNKRSSQHRFAKERDFHNVFAATSHLEGITLNASRRRNSKKQLPACSPVRDDWNSANASEFWDEITPTPGCSTVQDEFNDTLKYSPEYNSVKDLNWRNSLLLCLISFFRFYCK